MNRKFFFSILAGIAAALAACGGGLSGHTRTAADAAVRVNTGPIAGFGSVFVNGVEYDTHHAEIVMDGAPRLEDDLRLGMIVTVTGTINADGTTGEARKIEFNDNVQGAVDAVDPAHHTVVVMGQTVVTDGLTIFDGVTPAELVPGNVVEVSGLADAAGVIHATHVELKAATAVAGDVQEVKGEVAHLDETAKTFSIQALKIDYAGARLTGLAGGLANGMTVEVQTTSTTRPGGVVIASQLRPFKGPLGRRTAVAE